MKIPRIYANLDKLIQPNKALIIFGPRQVGKTTLIKDFLSQTTMRYRLETGDDAQTQVNLSVVEQASLKEYVAGYDLLVIDEAQRIPNIGQSMKLLIDTIPGLRIIATGSSAFELAGQVGEPLTGRKQTLHLFPVAQLELSSLFNAQQLKQSLEDYLIFGSYPAVITALSRDAKIQELSELVGSYLLKDILELDRIKGSKVILDLLRLLAFQIGSEVSLSELGTKLSLDYKTVARYLDILEKAFIIYNLRGFSRNMRNEVTKKSKYYFWDVGIRNAVINNFNILTMRDDIGKLWENFLVIERLKAQAYRGIYANNFFWRTWVQQEVDWVEEREGKLFGYDFKWLSGELTKKAYAFLQNYPEAQLEVVNRNNYLSFLGL